MQGTTTNVSKVPYTNPPIVTTAMGLPISEPMSLPNTIVERASIVVSAVMSTGRSLVRPASIIASFFSIPASLNWLI